MRNAFEIFHISSQVIQFYLSIPKQEEFIEKILSSESYREFKEIVPTGKVNWETLRVRLFQFFSAANQSQGKFVSILCQQTIQEMLNEHLIFFEGVLEFKIFIILNQYLIAKQSMNKEDLKKLFSLVIWKSNFLHIILRVFMGYLIVVKVSKNTNISKVFNQISKLIGLAITQKTNVLYEKNQFYDDCKQFIQLWLKYIEGTSNQEQISQIKILINQLRKHFKEQLLYQDVMAKLEQLLTVSLNLQVTNSFQDVTGIITKGRRVIPVNNYMPVVNKLQIQSIGQRLPSDQSLTASKRIKTNQSQRSLKVKQMENDPIFQVQLENYHIGQMVRKGYFRIKQPVSLSTQTRTVMKSQPSFHQRNEIQLIDEQTVIQHEQYENDSIVEQPPLLNFIDIEPKISIKQPSSHLSDKSVKIEKKNSTFNPYKLRNLISSRFQQILDIAQDSESSSPNNQQKQSLIKRQNSHIQKEQLEEFNNFLSGGNHGIEVDGRRNSSRRSGVRVSTPEIAIQVSNQLTSDQESLKQSIKQAEIEEQTYFLQPSVVNKRLQRKNVVALKYGNSFFIESTNVYIPKFGFRFLYYKCVCDWRVKLILSQKKIVQLVFYEMTFQRITFTFDLIGLQFEGINNWGQICQQFIKQLQNLIGSQLSYLNYNQELTKHQYNTQSFLATEFTYELKEDQIKSMGLMKDVFRLLFNTYIFEQKVITGSKLKLCKEKDLTLIAMREIINVLNFYKYSIKKSVVNTNDNKYILLLNGMGETIKKNIGLINKLFNLRLNLCDGKYLLHKQLVQLKDLSIKVDELDNTFFLVKASLVISNQIVQQQQSNNGNQILYYHKNDYKAKPQLEIEFEIDGFPEYQSLRLKFESIEKILEKRYHYSAKHIIDIVLFQQNRFIPRFRDFIQQKLMINEQKQLAIRLNIFSLQDAQKLEACGMKLGFLLDLKTKVKPFAITEIERYIHDDTQKKLEYEQTTQEIYKRQHLFDKHFNKIFSDENENQDIERRNKSSLIELVKRYQLNIFENKQENTQKVGPIQIYSDNPFTDQHLDDYDYVKSQFFVRNNFRKYHIIHFRIGMKGFSIKYNGGLETRFHEGKRYQKFQIPHSEEDEQNIQLSCQFIKNAPKMLIEHTLYKKMSVRLLRTSFRNTTLHDGFDMMKQIQSRSTLSEIPSYNLLHFILLNNCNYLLRFFNLKQFVLVQKIKNYGKFQIIIRVFYRFQQTDILTENDYFIMRLDFQDIYKKIGMMKLIFNRYDIVDILKIPIFTIMTDTSIVQIAMDIFHHVHLGIFALQSVPYFLYKPHRNQNQFQDHSTSEKVSRIRRINNYPENSSFKKADFCKGFLDHFIQNHRLVLTYIKKLYLITQNNYGQIVRISRTPHTNLTQDQVQNQEFIVLQVYRHLLLDQWILKIYVPRTTRFMATVIKNEDFRVFDQTLSNTISDNIIGKVLEKISQNTDPIPFKDFDHFSQMNNKFKTATQLRRVSTREKSTLGGRKMSNFNLKPISRDLNDFFNLTNQLSEISEIEKIENNKYSHLEKKIWMNFINDQINYEPYSKKNSAFLSLLFQDQEFPMQEQLFQRYIRIERIGESHIEFYLKYMQKPQEQLKGFALLKGKLNLLHNNRISGLVQEIKYNEEQVRQLKKTSIFFPFDAISYANTSNYNIELMYFSYNKFTEVREQINLRELLNLYIADGFFKYQTNYMNSKLNLSDVLNICYYIIYKIKNQNFLNLSQYHTIPNLNQFNPRKESHKQAIQQYKCFIKPYFCVIQQYYEEIKITCQHRTTLIEINQMFQIAEIEEQVFGFKQLTTKYPRLALERLSKVLVKLMNINTKINQ